MAFENKPVDERTRQSSVNVPVEKWTMTDELTHDFSNSVTFKEYCLAQYGQYMSSEGVRVLIN